MSATAADLLAGWRAWRTSQAAEPVPSVPGAAQPPGTDANPQQSAIVPGVPGVPANDEEGRTERRAEAAQARADAPPCPDGFLYLSGLAVRLDVALRAGATVARCPTGALDLTLPDGRAWLLSPSVVARLAAARLLPAVLAEREPDPIEAAERAAVCGSVLTPRPYQPGASDLLRDGLLRGWRDHRGPT
ncbi:hypothetical protein [Falsiroseomonas oryzae]|uniref:hypothetical protein n=1 Tax=Falsiroseomonas oryzae TaxID=2766473 RepID=UPI0022EA4D96|nr:hypothetical protein [Roseomonas sp. MO-31]